jgi:predicted peroxiredoxin
MNTIRQIPQIAQLLKGSNYIDVKTIGGQTSLRQFIASMTVEMMELDEERLIEGVRVWTAENFLKYAKDCKICLFT